MKCHTTTETVTTTGLLADEVTVTNIEMDCGNQCFLKTAVKSCSSSVCVADPCNGYYDYSQTELYTPTGTLYVDDATFAWIDPKTFLSFAHCATIPYSDYYFVEQSAVVKDPVPDDT